MTEVMISISSKWCKLIVTGEKTVEIRKTKPNVEPPFKCYVYCKVNDEMLFVGDGDDHLYPCNGKVMGEFVCDKIYDVVAKCRSGAVTKYTFGWNSGEERHCMTFNDVHNYLNQRSGYAWRITQLKVYDKPKDIGEFLHNCPCRSAKNCNLKAQCGRDASSCNGLVPLKYPFQGWGTVFATYKG